MKVRIGSKHLSLSERIGMLFYSLDVEKESGEISAEQIVKYSNLALELLWEAKGKLDANNVRD